MTHRAAFERGDVPRIEESPCPDGGIYGPSGHPHWFLTCSVHAGIREASDARRLCRELLAEVEALGGDLAAAVARVDPQHARNACEVAIGREGVAWCWEHGRRVPGNDRSACFENQRVLNAALAGLPVAAFSGDASHGVMDGLIEVGRLKDRVYCFDNGRYVCDANGRLACSSHGEVADQPFVDDHGRVIEVLTQPPLASR